tara:strand:+ start:1063 stop:1497 length:435 start_codon:yes stop_codon:yes gene_type:complete
MAWPANANNIVTTNLDAGSDNPASARPNLKAALDEITNIINGRNQASGVAGLDASSKITNTQLPDTIISSSSTDLTLTPNTGTVNINSVIQMNPQSRSALYARSDLADGMIAMASDGDSTVDTPVYYAGGVFRYFSDNSEVPSS